VGYHIEITSEWIESSIYSPDENQYMPEQVLRTTYWVCDGNMKHSISEFRATTAINKGTIDILFDVESNSVTGQIDTYLHALPADAHEDQAIGIDWQDDADDIADTGVPACDMDGGGDLPF